MRDGIDTLQRTGAQLGMSYILAQLADAHAALGQPSEGLAQLNEALALVESTGERWYEAELHRITGELRLQGDGHARNPGGAKKTRRAAAAVSGVSDISKDSAEACFRTAMEIARRQEAKSLELRAATSLAHLWRGQGKRRQAHEVPSEIYGWFTEGFDTADLRDAHSLLAELA
jgi:predicted ATPase